MRIDSDGVKTAMVRPLLLACVHARFRIHHVQRLNSIIFRVIVYLTRMFIENLVVP